MYFEFCILLYPTAFITAGADCDEYVCLSVCGSVCLSARISPEPHPRSLPTFLCMLPVSVARSSSGIFTIGHIAYRRKGVLFHIENALSAGKGGRQCTALAKYAIYERLPCSICSFSLMQIRMIRANKYVLLTYLFTYFLQIRKIFHTRVWQY